MKKQLLENGYIKHSYQYNYQKYEIYLLGYRWPLKIRFNLELEKYYEDNPLITKRKTINTEFNLQELYDNFY
ncbi:MAG: hypothetical protein RR370_01730 [Synergistaceae bacterium]